MEICSLQYRYIFQEHIPSIPRIMTWYNSLQWLIYWVINVGLWNTCHYLYILSTIIKPQMLGPTACSAAFGQPTYFFWTWGPYGGDYEEYGLLCCNSM
jgi:hypothetical protein